MCHVFSCQLSWPHPSCYLIIGSFALPVFPSLSSFAPYLFSLCLKSCDSSLSILTWLCPALPCPALPALPCLALPCLALPNLVASCPVFPLRDSFSLFVFFANKSPFSFISPWLPVPLPKPWHNLPQAYCKCIVTLINAKWDLICYTLGIDWIL